MPIRGIILIFLVAMVAALCCREEIYEWFTSEFSDEDHKNDEENQEENSE